jgi:hypothetical protein
MSHPLVLFVAVIAGFISPGITVGEGLDAVAVSSQHTLAI